MRTIETKVYTFDELDEKAKDKARTWWKECNDYPFLSEAMHEEAGELLKKAHIKAETYSTYYSLGYCQGDGAMIALSGTWKSWNVSVKQVGIYSHERSTDITLTSTKTGDYAPEKTAKDFEENLYIPLCKKLRDYGYALIEEENSDEYVEGTILANEYTFTIDGKRFG